MTFKYSRRSILAAATTTAIFSGWSCTAAAQNYPEKGKPIKAICPSAAGSATDGVARAYAMAMGEILGSTIVVDNRPGAEGVIGMSAVKSAPADGYTILFTSLSTQVLNPHLHKELSYNPQRDFIPVAGTMKGALMLAVGPSVTHKTAKEFFSAAKANPGKFTIASVSTTTRLAAEMMMKAAGIDLLIVPYKNIGDLVTNLMGGNVDAFVADGPTLRSYFDKGIRPLAVASANRLSFLPDVPTLKDAGVSGLEMSGWHAMYLPAGTPAPVVMRLQDAMRKASGSKIVKDYLSTFGVESLDLYGDDLAAFQKSESDKWGKAVRDAGLSGTK